MRPRWLVLMLVGCAAVDTHEVPCSEPAEVCDGTCVNTQTDDQNCGSCGHVCEASTYCDGTGQCACAFASCGGNCIDPMTSDQFCGATGDCAGQNAGVDCTAANQTCVMGSCHALGTVFYEGLFLTMAVTTPQQCTDYNLFKSRLGAGGFSSMRLYGSNKPSGWVCNEPAAVNAIAVAMRTEVDRIVMCGTDTWQYCASRFGGMLWVNAPGGLTAGLCSGQDCSGPGQAMLRPCIGVGYPGDGAGIDSTACVGPNQTAIAEFRY